MNSSIETSVRLKHILLAMDDYRSEHQRYPDHLGKNHSWRVEILDLLDGSELVLPFDKTQRWNSDANQESTGCNVLAFTSLRAPSQSTRYTHFVLVVDDGTVFNKSGVLRDDQITDGLFDTAIMLEIIDSDIPWSEPRDINIDEAIKFIQSFPEHLEPRIGLANGQILSISPSSSAEKIRAVFLANDGKVASDF